jgi:hypothetical protein
LFLVFVQDFAFAPPAVPDESLAWRCWNAMASLVGRQQEHPRYPLFEPSWFVKPGIDVSQIRIRFRFYKDQLDKRFFRAEISYEGEDLGYVFAVADGFMNSNSLKLGKGARYHGHGFGTLSYMVAAVEIYDRTGLVLHSNSPSRDAQEVWKNLQAQGLATKTDDKPPHWKFNESALKDNYLNPIRAFIKQQASESP